jgi:hypothetical protein
VLLGGGLSAAGAIELRSVYLTDSFRASAAIQLNAADIGGSLELAPRRLQEDKRRVAVDATDLKVTGRLLWMPERPAQGQVSLEGAAVGNLDDVWTGTEGQTREASSRCWSHRGGPPHQGGLRMRLPCHDSRTKIPKQCVVSACRHKLPDSQVAQLTDMSIISNLFMINLKCY